MAKETRRVHISVTSNAATSLNKGTAAAGGLSTSLKGVGASATAASSGIKAMTMALISSGVGALVVGLGMLVAGFGAVINKSAEFAVAVSNLKAIIGADKDESIFKELAADAKRLGASTAFTAIQVVELQTEFAKLGFTKNQILDVTEATLNLAAATKTDLATAAAVAGGALRGFGLQANETGRVTDVMALAFSSSTLDISKFQESVKYVAPVSKLLKVSVEETTASLGILADRMISGSMAGTNLRKVMSKLATKTGLEYNDALKKVGKELAAATTESEKLAIAQSYVGDRAYGALIALAENTDELDELTKKLETSAEGYAKLAAEAQLDNLTGDVTKLGSAWEGFLLGMEDGDGILSKMARGTIQFFTFAVQATTEAFQDMSRDWNLITTGLEIGANWIASLSADFKMFGVDIDRFAINALLALADVPFFGGAVNKEALLKEKAGLAARHAEALEMQGEYAKKALDLDAKMDKIKLDALLKKSKTRAEEESRVMKSVTDEFRTGEAGKDDEKAAKEIEDRKIFLAKLRKLNEDEQDKTEIAKIERKRQRHIAELATIVMNDKERAAALLAINQIYNDQVTAQELKNKEKKKKLFDDFDAKFKIKSDDPLVKLAEQKDAHLLELEQLKIEETEKAELRLSIDAYYKDLEQKANAETAAKKAEEDAKLLQMKKDTIHAGLDAVIQASGDESKVGQALFKIKQAMMLAELVMKMKATAQEMGLIATKANTEVAVDAAKQGSSLQVGMANASKMGPPFNAITMAMYAVQAGMMIKNMVKSKKEMKKITAGMGGRSVGGGGGASVQAPAFNVVGNTSNDANFIGDTIAGANSRPMRAYVVAEDVTSNQALRRNAENEASVG